MPNMEEEKVNEKCSFEKMPERGMGYAGRLIPRMAQALEGEEPEAADAMTEETPLAEGGEMG